MQWLNEPASWQRTGDVLRVSVDPGTDFWRATGYGYIHDNGHVYGELLPADLDVSVRVRGSFASQYDQAGIMLRADEQTWLKTGVEFFEGRPRLSTVLTLGWSSWIVADLPAGTDEVTLRVSRRGEAVEVRYTTGTGRAELAALMFLPPARELLAGICCAAPEGGGFTVDFHELRAVGRDWAAAGRGGWEGEPAAPATEWAGGEAADGPPGWAAERPATDWAEPPASAAAQDWEQLSQRVTGGRAAGREPEPPAGPAPADPAGGDSTGEPASLGGAGDSPARAHADDTTDPAMPAASDEAGQNGEQPAAGDATRGRPGGKAGGRGKPRARPAPEPADAADEWISLLTADPADQQPGPQQPDDR
jgi:regulation of enolase protein 1 (concanavalin A-like superfamily)